MLKNFVDHLKRKNFSICAVYLLDSQVCITFMFYSVAFSLPVLALLVILFVSPNKSFQFLLKQFMTDVTKFISGCMSSLSAMVQLEVPHVNILSKMDLVAKKKDVEEWDTLFSLTVNTLHVFSICLAYFNCSICSAFLMFQFLESGASSFVIRVESTHGSSVCKAKQIFG